MNALIRISRTLHSHLRRDLDRRHEFAVERVGFLLCRHSRASDTVLLFPVEYLPVNDNDYVDSDRACATINTDAIRQALLAAKETQHGCLHVHKHHGFGIPWFSAIDEQTNQSLAPPLRGLAPKAPHGALVLNDFSGAGMIWTPGAREPVDAPVSVVGFPYIAARESGCHGQ